MKKMKTVKLVLPAIAALAAIVLTAGDADAAPGYYTLNFAASNCIEDPDGSNNCVDYTAYGLMNECTGSTSYIYCPLNYISALTVDGNETTYDPDSDNYFYARADVLDTQNQYQIGCRAYGSDALDGDSNYLFDYESSSWHSTGDAFMGVKTLNIVLNSAFSDDIQYMFLYCYLERKRTGQYMQLIGYKVDYWDGNP